MTLQYPAKADTDIVGTAVVLVDGWQPGDLNVAVNAQTTAGTVVVEGVIKWWTAEMPKP